MSTWAENIQAEIAAEEVKIASLKAHLASGESYLSKEAGLAWAWFRGLFSHPAVTPAVAAVLANAPAPTTPPPA